MPHTLGCHTVGWRPTLGIMQNYNYNYNSHKEGARGCLGISYQKHVKYKSKISLVSLGTSRWPKNSDTCFVDSLEIHTVGSRKCRNNRFTVSTWLDKAPRKITTLSCYIPVSFYYQIVLTTKIIFRKKNYINPFDGLAPIQGVFTCCT